METELSHRDLCLVRLRFLDLLKSFFQDQPDAERLSRWRGIFAALSGAGAPPSLEAAIHGLVQTLEEKGLEQIRAEHYSLFVDPYSRDLLPLNAAYYLDGKSYGASLAEYRELLKEGQLLKEQGVVEAEDSLVLMLDALIAFIQEEKQGQTETRQLQERLLHRFLLPTARRMGERINTISGALFYRKCVGFLGAYLELEGELLDPPPLQEEKVNETEQ